MTEVEIAQILTDVLAYCKNEWYPQYEMVKYCVTNNTEGLNYVISVTDKVQELLNK